MLEILKRVHPRHVIWFLLVALFTLIAFVGKQYNTRLEGLEEYKSIQNGHLGQIDVRLERIDTSQQHMAEDMKELKDLWKRRNP